jgi:hypothetical protein
MKINDIYESTTAGSIATVSAPMTTQSRNASIYGGKKGGNLLTGKKTNKKYANSKVTESKKNVQEADLQEDDLILVPGQGLTRKTGLIKHGESRLDHEVEMARSDLFQAAKNAKKVYEMIKDVSEEEGLEGWVQEKIIKSNDYLNTIREYLEGKQVQGMTEAGFPGAPDIEMPPMKSSGDPQRDKLKQEYMDLHREIKSLVDIPYSSNASPEQKSKAKTRIKQLNHRADQIKAILEPRKPPNEWQKKTYGYDDNWNIVRKGMAENGMSIGVIAGGGVGEGLDEEGKGLWANIHAKRERIKKGSGERMRKPGSKGAPKAQDFKDAAKEEITESEVEDRLLAITKKYKQRFGKTYTGKRVPPGIWDLLSTGTYIEEKLGTTNHIAARRKALQNLEKDVRYYNPYLGGHSKEKLQAIRAEVHPDEIDEGIVDKIKGAVRREKAKDLPLVQTRRDYAMSKGGEAYNKGETRKGNQYMAYAEKDRKKKGDPTTNPAGTYRTKTSDYANEAAGQKYEMRFSNGKTQRFVADTPEEAKKKAKGLGATSIIKVSKDGEPQGKVNEAQSMSGALKNTLAKAEPGSKLDQSIKRHNANIKAGQSGTLKTAPTGYHFDKKGYCRLGDN